MWEKGRWPIDKDTVEFPRMRAVVVLAVLAGLWGRHKEELAFSRTAAARVLSFTTTMDPVVADPQ